jgi:hypothetical protein
MLIRKFERQNVSSFDEIHGIYRRPIVVMRMPPQPTENEFFNRLLDAIDAPNAYHGIRGSQLRTSAIRLLQVIGTRVLVIDRIFRPHLVRADSGGTAGLECPTAKSRRLFMEIAGARCTRAPCKLRGTLARINNICKS